MAQKAGYQGIKKFTPPIDITSEGTLFIEEGFYQKTELSEPIEGQSTVEGALDALSNANQATRQLIDDTVGWESINLADIPEADQTFTLIKSSERYKYVILNKPISSGSYHLSIKISDIANLTSAVRIQLINDQSQAIWSDSTTMTADGKYDFDITLASEVTKFYIFLRDTEADNATVTISEIMITAPIYAGFPYRPYHASVDSCKADNTVIAPVENGATVQKPGGYAVGSHAIRNGAFITWKNAKAQGETIADSDYDSGDVASAVADITQSTVTLRDGFSEQITLDSNRNWVIKQGNVVDIKFRITVLSDIESAISPIQVPYMPRYNHNLNINSTAQPYPLVTDTGIYINGSNGRVTIPALTVGTYDVWEIYICQ